MADMEKEPLKPTGPETAGDEERVPFHPSPLQRALALLGVVALILLFVALLYLIRRMK